MPSEFTNMLIVKHWKPSSCSFTYNPLYDIINLIAYNSSRARNTQKGPKVHTAINKLEIILEKVTHVSGFLIIMAIITSL